jgi:hypothetical protein
VAEGKKRKWESKMEKEGMKFGEVEGGKRKQGKEMVREKRGRRGRGGLGKGTGIGRENGKWRQKEMRWEREGSGR